MNAIRIKDDLPLEKLYSVENPPAPKPLPPRRVKFEREQARMDKDRRLWFNRMVWGQWTVAK